MEFKLDLGSLRFESGSGKTCSTFDISMTYGSAGTMLAFDVPDTTHGYSNTELVCTNCMWNTFKTVIKLLSSGKKLI